jgi:hypothetical protein
MKAVLEASRPEFGFGFDRHFHRLFGTELSHVEGKIAEQARAQVSIA